MCEIAVVDPEQTDVQSIFQLASTLYEEQGDGVGILAVLRDEDEGKFEYRKYKSAKPAWQSLWSFLRRNAERTWRFIVHARAMTDGDVNRQNTHPLSVDCEQCDTQWMVHNGVVRKHKKVRGGLVSNGHTFSTEVDSEVIAHKHGEIPDTLDDIDDHRTKLGGSLNYILAGEERILVHLQQKYHVTDDFVVTCATRKRKEPFKDFDDMDNESEWILISPDGEMEREERKRWYGQSKYRGRGTNRTGKRGTKNKWNARQKKSEKSSDDSGAEEQDKEYVSEVYEDLLPKTPGVSAYKVAPGVIKIREGGEDGREDYVKRRDEPALYSYYATDEPYPGDDWLDFARLFDGDGDLRPADEIDDDELRGKAKELEEEVIHDATQQTIDEIAEGEDFR